MHPESKDCLNEGSIIRGFRGNTTKYGSNHPLVARRWDKITSADAGKPPATKKKAACKVLMRAKVEIETGRGLVSLMCSQQLMVVATGPVAKCKLDQALQLQKQELIGVDNCSRWPDLKIASTGTSHQASVDESDAAKGLLCGVFWRGLRALG